MFRRLDQSIRPQCATWFIGALDYLGWPTLNDYFNSNVGILGLTMYFEAQGRVADRGQVWIGIGWTFI